MWQQQQQQDLYQVDFRLLKECQPLETATVRSSGNNLFSFAASNNNNHKNHSTSSSIAGSDLCCWQRAASLVQSPASANSESSTSTPDQCPPASTVHHPAAAVTICEMPGGSWNGNNNVMKEIMQQTRNLPSSSQSLGPCPLESAVVNWSKELDASSFLLADDPQYLHSSQAPTSTGWNSVLNESSTVRGYSNMVEGLNDVSKAEFPSTTGFQPSTVVDPSLTSPDEGRMTSSFNNSSLYVPEGQRIKQEMDQFPGLEKIFAFHTTNPQQAESSKIGNFIDLLRQSDRPISDATAAASCNHLSQLLSSQEAPGMWTARSNRLPAMLSEVLPPSSAGGKAVDMLTERSKRPFPEASSTTSNVDSAASTHSSPRRKARQQEGEEPRAAFGVAANDDITSELFTKRPRIENSSSFPFKMQVRKEKLGERISALQQLVSPFGKTDTASVLLEAIGYIKFLHEQVQVLSSPYMKQTSRHNEHGKFCWSSCDKQSDNARQDLRSRGLCLVPISCTLQVANDNGADYWTPTLHGQGGLK